jgi:hypothetical protein
MQHFILKCITNVFHLNLKQKRRACSLFAYEADHLPTTFTFPCFYHLKIPYHLIFPSSHTKRAGAGEIQNS